MIRSRCLVSDPVVSCARCRHLKPGCVCGIDNEDINGIITMLSCDKFKEVEYGTTVHAGPEAD